MKLTYIGRLLLAFLIGLFAVTPDLTYAATRTPVRARNTYFEGVVDATATQTFATTSYADLAAATVTLYPAKDPNVTEAPGGPYPTVYVRAVLTWAASKATAGSGTCGLYVNGAVLAKTAQTISFLSGASNGNVSAEWLIPNTTSGAQTIKVQCKSSDTNVFTVSNLHLLVYSEE